MLPADPIDARIHALREVPGWQDIPVVVGVIAGLTISKQIAKMATEAAQPPEPDAEPPRPPMASLPPLPPLYAPPPAPTAPPAAHAAPAAPAPCLAPLPALAAALAPPAAPCPAISGPPLPPPAEVVEVQPQPAPPADLPQKLFGGAATVVRKSGRRPKDAPSLWDEVRDSILVRMYCEENAPVWKIVDSINNGTHGEKIEERDIMSRVALRKLRRSSPLPKGQRHEKKPVVIGSKKEVDSARVDKLLRLTQFGMRRVHAEVASADDKSEESG